MPRSGEVKVCVGSLMDALTCAPFAPFAAQCIPNKINASNSPIDADNIDGVMRHPSGRRRLPHASTTRRPAASARSAFAAYWTTVSAYLGADSLSPFVGAGHGAFALVRTSNPSGDAVQSLRLADGRTVAEAVADLVAGVGAASVGASGFSALGAVVGATKRADAAALRARMPQQIFLVPGFGAQGGGVDDVLPCFRADGRGALVTASRSVIYAFAPGDASWQDAVRRAAEELRAQIGSALGVRA